MRVPLPAARMTAWGAEQQDAEFVAIKIAVVTESRINKLARLDSNQESQDQNLVCYRYTTG